MSVIDKYIDFFIDISTNLEYISKLVIEKNRGKILSIIKLRLFNKGIDGSGGKISPEYSPTTILSKKIKNQRTSHVTLRDSGQLYRSFIVVFKNNNIFIEANTEYKDDLISKYGDDIFELTINEVRGIVVSFIEPEIHKLQDQLNDIDLTDEVL